MNSTQAFSTNAGGTVSFTNYSMNPKKNPYLAPSKQSILGYQMIGKHQSNSSHQQIIKQGNAGIVFRPKSQKNKVRGNANLMQQMAPYLDNDQYQETSNEEPG